MTTWRYLLFISSSREAEADAYQGLQDELNDLGQQGWELTAVTDEGDAKIIILKQPDLNLWRWLKRCTRKIIACEIPQPKTWLVAQLCGD